MLAPSARAGADRVGKLVRSALVQSGSEIEQARIRSGRFDHPRVQAETMGTSAIRAQPARRTSRRSRRRGAATSAARRFACARHRRGPAAPDRLSLDRGHLDQDRERTRKRSLRSSRRHVCDSSAWLMAAPSRSRKTSQSRRSVGFQPSAAVRLPVVRDARRL